MINVFVALFLCILFSSGKLYEINFQVSCTIGQIIENNVTRCLCTDTATFECYSTKVHQTDEAQIDSTVKYDTRGAEYFGTEACTKGLIYVLKDLTCVCRENNNWPHEECFSAFGSLANKVEVPTTCEPDSYVAVDCNICRCNEKGQIDKSQCTDKICQEIQDIADNIFSQKCIPKVWYALSPCQHCVCTESGTLICNTVYPLNTTNQVIDGYDLAVCGEDFLKDTIKLIPIMHMASTDVPAPTITVDDGDNKIRNFKNLHQLNDLDYNDLLKDFESIQKNNVDDGSDSTIDIRRSVALMANTDCVPGETKSVKKGDGGLCDVCFCLKNGKLLCSEKPC